MKKPTTIFRQNNSNLIFTKKINQLKSAQSFDLSRQPSGTYFIVVYHQGQRIGQQI